MPNGDENSATATPYLPWQTVETFLTSLRADTMPTEIDKSLMRGMAGGTQTQLIAALAQLGFIDEGRQVTERLRAFAAEEANRPAIIAEAMASLYVTQLRLASENATSGRLRESFMEQGIKGTTVEKAIRFFLGAAKYAGMPLSPHFATPRPGRPSGSRRKKKDSPKSASGEAAPPQAPAVQSSSPERGQDMKAAYFNLLLKKAESAEDSEILDRIERLLGVAKEGET